MFVDGKVTKSRGYLSVKTCEGFLCFVAIVRVRVYCVDFFVFCFTSLVSVTGSYTQDEPKSLTCLSYRTSFLVKSAKHITCGITVSSRSKRISLWLACNC